MKAVRGDISNFNKTTKLKKLHSCAKLCFILKPLCIFLVDPLSDCINYKLQVFVPKALYSSTLPYLTSK